MASEIASPVHCLLGDSGTGPIARNHNRLSKANTSCGGTNVQLGQVAERGLRRRSQHTAANHFALEGREARLRQLRILQRGRAPQPLRHGGRSRPDARVEIDLIRALAPR